MAQSGALDPTFGAGRGYVVTSFSPDTTNGLTAYTSAVVEPDGSVLADGPVGSVPQTFGAAFQAGGRTFGVVRVNAGGTPDGSFGVDGETDMALPAGLTPIGPPSSLLRQPDGKIVLVGTAHTSDGTPRIVTLVARFDALGKPDPTFGNAGVVTLDQATVGIPNPSLSYAALQVDGKIVLTGTGALGLTTQIASVRLTSDGGLDPNYGTRGLVAISHATRDQLLQATPAIEASEGVALQADGKIVLLASFDPTGKSFLNQFFVSNSIPELIRLNEDGSVDPSLSPAGIRASVASSPGPNGLIIQPDGQFLVLANANLTNYFAPILVRLNQDGSLEKQTAWFGPGTSVTSMSLQRNGEIVMAGYHQGDSFVALRTTATLDPDPTFGQDGVVVIPIPQASGPDGRVDSPLTARTVALGLRDEIYVLGQSYYNPTQMTAIVRLTNPQTVHGDFDGDGISDPAFYLPSLGAFAISYTASSSARVIPFGGPGPGITIPAPGDYTGSGHDEVAAYLPGLGIYAYRPSGGPDVYTRIGTPGPGLTLPAPGDYYGTGRDDVAVYLADIGAYAIVDPTGRTTGRVIPFGTPGVGMTIPVPGDYYGTGRDDVAVYLVDQGAFAILDPTGRTAGRVIPFGGPGVGNALPMPGDYDGSGRTELAAYLPALGLLAYRPAGGGPDVYIPFGGPGPGVTLPAPGDYTGSGRTEPGVYLPASALLAYRPTGGGHDVYIPFGIPGPGQTIPATSTVLSPTQGPGTGQGLGVSAFASSVEVPNVAGGLDPLDPPTPARKAKAGGRPA